jgi:GAF domain-containing protein/HAMP domain-containing protein/anti-sigma regulatory factor (Ser/Thr protein kinase)
MLRLVSYYLLLSLATAGLVGFITYHRARDMLKQSVFDRLTAVANLKEEDLRHWVLESRDEVLLLAGLPGFRSEAVQLLQVHPSEQARANPEHQAAYDFVSEVLNTVLKSKAPFRELAIVSHSSGRVVVSTDKRYEGQYRNQDTYFRRATHDVFVQNIYISPHTGELTITIAAPLLDADDQRLGILVAHLDLAQMDHFVLERSGLGQSGETYLVDQHNIVVTGERFDPQEFPRGVHTEGARLALGGRQGQALYNNYEGIPVIADYRWISDLELALLTELHQAEAFAPAQRLTWTIVLVGLGSAILLATGVSLAAYGITRRVAAVTETAVQVAQGDLSPVAPVSGLDEIAALAQAFNEMTRRLRRLYVGLEQKVVELQEVKSALQRYTQRLEAQRAIDRAILEAHSPEEIAVAALTQLQHLIPCQRASVLTSPPHGEPPYLLATVGRRITGLEGGRPVPSDFFPSLLRHKTPQTVVIPDLRQMKEYSRLARLLLDNGIQSMLSVPLNSGSQFMGLLNVGSDNVNVFTTEHIEITGEVADQLAVAIRQAQLFATVQKQFTEKVELFEQAQQEIRDRQRAERKLQEAHDELEKRVAERTAELTLLGRAAQGLISTLELDQVLVTVLEELRNLLNVVACSVWLLDRDSNELVCRQSSGPRSEAVRGWRVPYGTGIVGWVAKEGRSLVVDDVAGDARHQAVLARSINLEPRSLLTVPLIVKGQVIGCLQALDTEVGRFSQSDRALIESLGATAAFAIENAHLYNQARRNAETQSVLLREVNHRVKNNLSAIIGLLYTERRHAALRDESTYQSIMQDLINRVQGLATVHSLLSMSGWAPISLSELVTRVAHSSLRALPSHKRLLVQVGPSTVYVTAEQANHLALIINELVTNSIKYGMALRLAGRVDVAITEDGEDVLLEFRDDGPGFPADVLDQTKPRYNVGFHLIANLVGLALNGRLQLYNDVPDNSKRCGAVVAIRFKVETVATARAVRS